MRERGSGWLAWVAMAAVGMSCTDGGGTAASKTAASTESVIDTDGPTDARTPVGLALEVDNGVGVPLTVRSGQRFFINQIDLRASAEAEVDEGLDALQRTGDFAGLDWRGLELEEQEPILLPNEDGTFTHRRFFRDAAWMDRPSVMAVWQVGEHGAPTSRPLLLYLGSSERRGRHDAFFVRRLRGIQWVTDCPSLDDCAGAEDYLEEALVEVRNSRRPERTFRIRPRTTGLRLWWSARPGRPYEIPLAQREEPGWDYGFRIALEPLTEPGPGGYYTPGTDVTFRITLMDGSGERLHPEGSLPTYADVAFGGEPSGIQYYRAFFDASATYWRRKHRERMLMVQMVGPNQDVQPIRSIADLGLFLDDQDTEVVARPEDDGVYAEFTLLPPANVIFGGAFTPGNPQWFEPNEDTFTFHIPEDAEPGTYKVTAKGRRTYLGEDIPRTSHLEIQVGTSSHTEAELSTGRCESCHTDGGELGLVLHANDDRAACAGCHVPLGFELEGPIAVRLHFIHSRSGRFDAPLEECSSCHIERESIQRTSKHACLSCHDDYPDWHVDRFGEIESIYIGGGRESFQQCTDSCHTTHPGSGF